VRLAVCCAAHIGNDVLMSSQFGKKRQVHITSHPVRLFIAESSSFVDICIHPCEVGVEIKIINSIVQ